MSAGTLFTEDFLLEGIRVSHAWNDLTDGEVGALRSNIADVFAQVADPASLNEAQTQHRIIEPILGILGWTGKISVQTNIERRRRPNVSDYSFFPDADAFGAADRTTNHDDKLKHAVAVGDAKQWSIGLDQSGGGAGVGETPSAQIIRYLTRAETVSNRAVRWGILTNGRHWRLYYTGARSLLDGYFEADVAWILGLPGAQGQLGDPINEDDTARRDRLFRTFVLFFRRAAFTPSVLLGNKTLPEFAFYEGRLWETKVRTSLSDVVFDRVFPGLIRALATTDPNAAKPLTPVYLNRVREAALTMLYRLLFALYAEDRDLLPTRDRRFDNYALSVIRDDIAARRDVDDVISARSTRYWDHCVTLFGIVDEGEPSLGIPPYNGGLFAKTRAPLIETVRLGDAIFAPLLDELSRTDKDGRKVRINFRDLSVRELGAIYEGLLEYEPVADPDAQLGIAVRPNPYSRKTSGSYYTPDELVGLIIERSVGPLVDDRVKAFADAADRLAADDRPIAIRLGELVALDPASAILDLKVCDPAMGSGHFLVSLIDYLSAAVFTATGDAAARVTWTAYQSPILQRLATIRDRIKAEAATNNWAVRDEQLTDANLVKRMVLKRCVYGVDKNPMAVELAKVSLWLHTFTTGAPLSFLDHHLKCGDSLFGEKVGRALDELSMRGALLISDAVRKAEAEVGDMQMIEGFTDAEVAEVKASAAAYAHVETGTAPLSRFLNFWQAIKWLDLTDADRRALDSLLDGGFGDPVEVAAGIVPPRRPAGAAETLMMALGDEPEQLTLDGSGVVSIREWNTVSVLIERAHALAAEEHFFHWEVAFPGVWRAWQKSTPEGGFDAIVGNPPWDRMKMQEVEWFAARDPKIARQTRAADRKAMIAVLIESRAPLGATYMLAKARAEKSMERARKSGDYPLLSRGDTNLYTLFIERAQSLLSPIGIAGLLTPSGILSDKPSEAFLKTVIPTGRVITGIDFFNKKLDGSLFFEDVYYRFKFCVFVCARQRIGAGVGRYGFFIRDVADAAPERLIEITEAMINDISPGSFLVPILRNEGDFELALRLADAPSTARLGESGVLKYRTLFHMAGDSESFLTATVLNSTGAFPLESGNWRGIGAEYERLFEGKMVQAFDHRAASIGFYKHNVLRTGESEVTTSEQYADPQFLAIPRFFVDRSKSRWPTANDWCLAIKDVTSTTNTRSVIATLIPRVAAGHTLPLLVEPSGNSSDASVFACANLNTFALDFFARQKIQNNHLTWHVLSQLPLITSDAYRSNMGTLSAPAGELVKDHTLRLTYTASDMVAFAHDLGHDDPPFLWNEDGRRHLRARLDALYFRLYGVTDEADIRYILSTFPIVEKKDRDTWDGVYLTAELILWYFRALAAGDSTSIAPTDVLVRTAGRTN